VQGLFQKVVRGELQTDKLVTLTSEQLASEELRQWRQQEIKKVSIVVCTKILGDIDYLVNFVKE